MTDSGVYRYQRDCNSFRSLVVSTECFQNTLTSHKQLKFINSFQQGGDASGIGLPSSPPCWNEFMNFNMTKRGPNPDPEHGTDQQVNIADTTATYITQP